MPPEQPTEPNKPSTSEAPINGAQQAKPGKSEKLIFAAIAAIVIFAILIGIIIALLSARNSESSQSNSNGNTSQEAGNGDENQSVQQARVVAVLPSSDPDFDVELLQPRKVGNTLVVNYNLVSKKDSQFVNGFTSGVYTTRYGINEEENKRNGVAEPYAISDSDGQKYGLARDDRNQPLASNDTNGRLDKGEKISGYVTLSLPPSGSTVSIFLGDMSAFTGIKVEY